MMSETPVAKTETKQGTWVTIVTSRAYTKDRFIRESKTLGVNRAVKPSVLREMSWGETIHTADWQSQAGKRFIAIKGKSRQRTAPMGAHMIFGQFPLEGINVDGFNAVQRAVFHGSLDVSATVDMAPTRVVRGCGTYVLGGGLVVRDTPMEIVLKALVIAEKENVKIRFFIGGAFSQIEPEYVIAPTHWSAGFRRMGTPTVYERNADGTIRFVEDYSYKPTKEEETEK